MSQKCIRNWIINKKDLYSRLKILVLNLPSEIQIMRRYNCTYKTRGFLCPPQELLRVATILKTYSSHQIDFLDAVAEQKNIDIVKKQIKASRYDVVITLLGLENIETELLYVNLIKKESKDLMMVGIGFYINKNKSKFSVFDVKLGRDFEPKIKEAAGFNGGTFIDKLGELESETLSNDPDVIPYVNREFLKENLYQDIFVSGKTAWLFYSFGCPYKCTYCIRSYDSRVIIKRNWENVFSEIRMLSLNGYKNIRFLDDNITLDVNFLIALNKFLEKEKIRLNFYGFSRLDIINREIAELLKKINFKRIYIGLETLSENMQEKYVKNINTKWNYLKQQFTHLKNNRIHSAIWIMFDPQSETLLSLAATSARILNLKINLCLLNILIPYENTELYNSRFINGSNQLPAVVKTASALKGFFAVIIFYGIRMLYPANWISLIEYFSCYPQMFIKAVFYDLFFAAGISAKRRIPIKELENKRT